MYVRMPSRGCVHVSAGAQISQKRASDFLEMELEGLVSCLTWVLETLDIL